MLTAAILNFLGGAAFRMIWGEVANWFNKKQEHSQEIERMKLQNELEAARFDRDQERIKLQSDLGIKEVMVKGDLDLQKADAQAFIEGIKIAYTPTGIKWVDAWNSCIRPAIATVALAIWLLSLIKAGFIPKDFDLELICVVFGFYFASRELAKRGK